MILSTLNDVPDKRPDPIGLVHACCCLNFTSMKDYKPVSSFVLGPGVGRNDVAETATSKAVQGLTETLKAQARDVGADAVLGVRLEMSPFRPDQCMLVLTGTAVKFLP